MVYVLLRLPSRYGLRPINVPISLWFTSYWDLHLVVVYVLLKFLVLVQVSLSWYIVLVYVLFMCPSRYGPPVI
jgi:hypothetical protein